MSLYNQLRPQTLDEVVGQENVKAQLRGVIDSGNIPNAMLLTGPRGTGKTTIARIVARQLNCEKGGLVPCGECESCKSILNGTSMDVVELDAASNNKVEDVRTIIEKAQYAPLSKYKVFILDEVHMFSQGAWNALLKLIEEPPKNVVFMLCTTEEHKVPATIISRCRKLYFEKIALSTVADYLASVCDRYGKAYEDDALKLIAQASEGCMRDALSIMEPFLDSDSLATNVVASTLGSAQEDAVFGILGAISEGDVTEAIRLVREQAQRGKNSQLLVKALIGAVTDTMFVLNGTDVKNIVNTSKYKELLTTYATKVNIEKCLELSRTLTDVYGAIAKVPDALFLIESSLLRVVEYESRVTKLERRLAVIEENGVVAKVENATSPVEVKSQNIVSFPQESAANIPETVAVNGDVQPNVLSSDEELQAFIHNLPIPVEEEDVSRMDFVPQGTFESGPIVEDEIPSGFFDADPATLPPAFSTPVVNEVSATTKTSEPVTQSNNTVDSSVDAQSDTRGDDFDDLLSHLPQGTMVVGAPAPKPAPAVSATNNQTPAPSVGETEPEEKSDSNPLPMGFEGFSDWL